MFPVNNILDSVRPTRVVPPAPKRERRTDFVFDSERRGERKLIFYDGVPVFFSPETLFRGHSRIAAELPTFARVRSLHWIRDRDGILFSEFSPILRVIRMIRPDGKNPKFLK